MSMKTLSESITDEDIELIKRECMKPEEIIDKDSRQYRVDEIEYWMLRFAKGGANPKWFRAHTYELLLAKILTAKGQ